MSVWFAIPSCRHVVQLNECLAKWHAMGYKIALLRQGERSVLADFQIETAEYIGWARSTNILARQILRMDPQMQFCIGGGDDYFPEPNIDPAVIAHGCFLHFEGTFGVMQPTGDRWGDDAASRHQYGEGRGAYIDRVAGSPWMGREWIERAYLGNGPMWDGYHHCFADEELQETAQRLGRFWQRPDLIQHHDHPGRKSFDIADWPAHLAPAITGANWDRDQALFRDRKRKGFPGHQPV